MKNAHQQQIHGVILIGAVMLVADLFFFQGFSLFFLGK
jgi:hypothetical protein